MRSKKERKPVLPPINLRTLLGVEPLEDRIVPAFRAVPPALINPPAAPITVTLDSNGDARANAGISRNEVDWYKITATDGNYTFRARTPHSSVDTVIGVWNADGQRVKFNNNINRYNRDSVMTTHLAAGTYYFGVSKLVGTQSGRYTWSIDGPTPPPGSAPGPVGISGNFTGQQNVNLTQVRITFDRSVDPTSFTTADIFSFNGPNGSISASYIVAPVLGSDNKQFDVTFTPQTTAGSYTMVIGPDIRDLFGNPMNQDADGTSGESPDDRYSATGTLTLPGTAPGPVASNGTFSGVPFVNFSKMRVTFDRPVDPATFTSSDIVSFSGPNGSISSSYTIAAVSGTNNTQFDVTFTAQTALGSYTMVIGPDIRDTSGNPMNQDADGTSGESPDDRYTASGTLTGPAAGPVASNGTFSGVPFVNFSKMRVTFDRPVDVSTFTSADIFSFSGPNGSISSSYTIAAVSGTNNTQFDVTFTAQTALGSYTMVIGPDIRDTSGNRMNQDADGTSGESPDDRYTASGTLTGPAAGPVASNGTFSGQANVNFSKMRVTFDRPVDVSTFTSADIFSFSGPNGSISSSYTIAAVSGTNNTQFDVTFTAQTALGSYTMVIGPDIRDTSGNRMNQDADGTSGESPDDRYTATGTLTVSGGYHIELQLTGFTASQETIFRQAAARWEEVIIGDLPDVTYNGSVVDDLLIVASSSAIDGRGGILGSAGPDRQRSGSNLPYKGSMDFDSADLDWLESNGSLIYTIMHEMGHVIGVGTIWTDLGLLTGRLGSDPRFTGSRAVAEYNSIFGTNATGVPVENTGGSGTRDAHWRDSVFGNELMTGWLSSGANPLSRVTAASMADLGYTVDMSAADDYTPPGGNSRFGGGGGDKGGGGGKLRLGFPSSESAAGPIHLFELTSGPAIMGGRQESVEVWQPDELDLMGWNPEDRHQPFADSPEGQADMELAVSLTPPVDYFTVPLFDLD